MIVSYINIAIKLAMGLLSIVMVINYTGKGNLAPSSASDQVQNYVLGGIIGGVIYNENIGLLQYFIILLIWVCLVLSLRWLKTNSAFFKKAIDGEPSLLISRGKLDTVLVERLGLLLTKLCLSYEAIISIVFETLSKRYWSRTDS